MKEKFCFNTERLLIRSIDMMDSINIFKYRSDSRVCYYQTWNPKNISDVEKFIKENCHCELNIPNTWHQLVMIETLSEEIIGDIGLHFIDNEQVEIGYTLSYEEQDRGYATEAVTGTINYLFGELYKHRVLASVNPDNKRSISLLERVNMRKEAHFNKSFFFRGKWVDECIYAILREEWNDNKI